MQVNHAFESLFFSLDYTRVFVNVFSKLKDRAEEDSDMVNHSYWFGSMNILTRDSLLRVFLLLGLHLDLPDFL